MAPPMHRRHGQNPEPRAKEISSTSRFGRKGEFKTLPHPGRRRNTAASSASPVAARAAHWDTQKWLIGKRHAHIEHGRLVADTDDARQVIDAARLRAAPHRGRPLPGQAAPNVPEKDKPTPAQKRARRENIKKAQAARHAGRLSRSAACSRPRGAGPRSAPRLFFLSDRAWQWLRGFSATKRRASPFAGAPSRSRSHTAKTSRFFAGLRLVAARTCCGDSRSPDSIRRRCAVPGSRGAAARSPRSLIGSLWHGTVALTDA